MDGEDIRAARERAGMSRPRFAELAGVSLRTVGNWERSASPPKRAFRLAANVLGPIAVDGAAVVEAVPAKHVTLEDLSGLVERVERLEEFQRRVEELLRERNDAAPRDVVEEAAAPRESAAAVRVSGVDSSPSRDGGVSAAAERLLSSRSRGKVAHE
ncbi:helix-turn-helix domain-containing protein [Isoptericola sp. NPDC058082]|uniref:helix-turn-helix domain-containing protein n=1 Tax=Isoptericola sp. NPDC058082 TaxID=3346331 RepID=UPI0036E9DD4A